MAVSDRTLVRLPRTPDQPCSFRFGPFLFDPAALELSRGGRLVPAPTLSLNLLAYLLLHRDRVIDRRELLLNVWGGTVVSEGSLRQAIWELRQMLEDTAKGQHVIRTVRGQGYRFVAPLLESEPPSCAELLTFPSAARPGTLVGRTPELAALDEAQRTAAKEGGRACALIGAAGVGKTRLAWELASAAAERGIACLDVATDPDGAAPAFWPWLQLVRGLLDRMEEPARTSLTQSFPGAQHMLQPSSAHPPLRTSDPAVGSTPPEQFAVMSELAALLVAALAQRPTLLLIEDLQWSDDGTLALFRHLLQLLPQTRTLVLTTCRSQRPRDNRQLARTLDSIQRSATGHLVELSSFGLDEVAQLLALHARNAVSDDLVRQVFELSQGNPLFASELALHLAPAGRALEPLREADLKDFVSVIQRRLLALPESALRAVCAASVFGPEFTLAELAVVAEQEPQQALVSLEVAIDQRVVTELDERTFRLAHPLTRQAAYELLSRAERCRLHAVAGGWLERHSVDARGTRPQELAHHFYRAAPEVGGEKAVHYALRCAQLAYDASAYQDAVAHYDRALTCMDLDPARSLSDKLEVALQRAEALRATGADATRLNAQFLALAEQAESLGGCNLFARAVLGFTGQRTAHFTPTRFVGSCSPEEIALIERALDALGPQPSEYRALLLCSLMGALVYSAEKRRRDDAAEEATQIARKLATPALLVRVLMTKIYCCARPQNADERLADCNELLDVAERHGLRGQQVDGLITRALAHLSRGDVHLAALDEARAKALAKGAPRRTVARSALIDLMRAFWTGDLAEARTLTQRAHDAASEDLAERTLYMTRCSTIHLLESGRLPDSVATYETMLRAFPEAVGLHCALASCHATLGNREQALVHFELAARDDFRTLPEHLGWLGEVALLADAAAWLDDADRARRVYDKLEPFGHAFDFFLGEATPAGPVAYWLGALAIAFRDLPLARTWLSVASEINQRVGATMLDPYSWVMLARIEKISGRSGEAFKLLDQVRSYAEPRKLAWLLTCAERERARLG